jgi:hypothetical protein
MINMEIILLIAAFLFLLTGLLGSVIPALPGPPLSFVGLLLLQWSGFAGFSAMFLVIWAAITIAVTIIDYLLPMWMTKRFGGSREAVVGSILGLLIGMFFFPPIGLVAGPFIGALTGELINNRGAKAFKVALGAFLAFIVGTGAKLIVCAIMIFYAVRAVIPGL